MKKVVQIVLGVAIIVLAWVLFNQVMNPLRFQEQQAVREGVIIEQLKDIRTAERAFKTKNNKYTGSFDELIAFVLSDSLEVKRSIGSEDDSVAVARGLVRTETFKVAVIDTIFAPKKLSAAQIQALPFYTRPDGERILMQLAAADFRTESEVVVPVFECKIPYTAFLGDLNQQELANLVDARVSLEKYAGLKVGAIDQATNDVGNWE